MTTESITLIKQLLYRHIDTAQDSNEDAMLNFGLQALAEFNALLAKEVSKKR